MQLNRSTDYAIQMLLYLASLIYKIPIQTARLYKQLTKETQDCPESVRICEKRLRCRL